MSSEARTREAGAELVEVLASVLPAGGGPYHLHEPEIGDLEKSAVCAAIDEGYVSSVGPQVAEFESRLASVCDSAHALATVNGTAALTAVLAALDIGPGDEVLCPALTFVATANAIRHCGAEPHFVDIEPGTLGVDATRLEEHLARVASPEARGLVNVQTGRRIAALVPVHVFGHLCDMPGLAAVAGARGLALVEDATEALGSTGAGHRIGQYGAAAVLSFNGNKIVTTGGGGAVLTSSEAFGQQVRHLATTAKLPHQWRYEHDRVGYNFRMPNINAALGLAQLDRLDGLLARKRALAGRYRAAFADARHWVFRDQPPGSAGNFWLNAVQPREEDAFDVEGVLSRLHAAGYMCRPCWAPMHGLPMYAGCPRDDLAETERAAACIVNLPSSARLGA